MKIFEIVRSVLFFEEEDIQFQLVWERAPLRGISHATLLVIEEEEEEAGID